LINDELLQLGPNSDFLADLIKILLRSSTPSEN